MKSMMPTLAACVALGLVACGSEDNSNPPADETADTWGTPDNGNPGTDDGDSDNSGTTRFKTPEAVRAEGDAMAKAVGEMLLEIGEVMDGVLSDRYKDVEYEPFRVVYFDYRLSQGVAGEQIEPWNPETGEWTMATGDCEFETLASCSRGYVVDPVVIQANYLDEDDMDPAETGKPPVRYEITGFTTLEFVDLENKIVGDPNGRRVFCPADQYSESKAWCMGLGPVGERPAWVDD